MVAAKRFGKRNDIFAKQPAKCKGKKIPASTYQKCGKCRNASKKQWGQPVQKKPFPQLNPAPISRCNPEKETCFEGIHSHGNPYLSGKSWTFSDRCEPKQYVGCVKTFHAQRCCLVIKPLHFLNLSRVPLFDILNPTPTL